MKTKKHMITWLVIANSVEAHFYAVMDKEYSFIQRLEHPESRLKSSDITSDRPGHYVTSHASHGQFSACSNPHQEEHAHFAKIIADILNQDKRKNQYQSLIICAEPRFYGLIKQQLEESVIHSISMVVEKDYIPLHKAKLDEVIKQIIQEII